MQSETRPRVAVVIPCYDEAPTVEKVVHDFAKALPEAEVFVFDNNSTDGTAELARRAGARVVTSPRQGKGNVVRHMAAHVDADVYVLVDGDDTYDAAAAPALLEHFRRDGLDMLVATRLEAHEPGAFRTFHRIGNRWISALISRLFGTRLSDVLSGYRVLSREFLDIVQLRAGGFEVETELTLQGLAKRMNVAETPVPYRSRGEGSESKLSTWSDGFLIGRLILMLFKDYKPLVFFGSVAVVLALLALVSGSAPVRDFMETGYVLHVPRAILAAALAILSVVSLTAGLILDTIAKLHDENIALWKRHLRGGPRA
ncbi:MAG: glycosyltransferase family 2 protein [Myxococcota bacterium]